MSLPVLNVDSSLKQNVAAVWASQEITKWVEAVVLSLSQLLPLGIAISLPKSFEFDDDIASFKLLP